MKTFLIILAVLVLLIALILSLSCEFTVIFDNGWTTKIKVLFIEKDIQLSKLLSFIVAPEKVASDVSENRKEKKDSAKSSSDNNKKTESKDDEKSKDEKPDEQKKPNFIKKLFDDEGVLGVMLLISNLLQTANSAIMTLFEGFHIYSLYVKMIIGGGDAADIGTKYGTFCGVYYPIKGMILNGMKVDQYDDYIQADFIAPRTETEFQFIGSINVALLLKVLLRAGKVFLVNLIKNK